MAILSIQKKITRLSKISFWFLLGAFLGFVFFTSFLYFIYRASYTNRIYEGIYVEDIDLGGKSQEEARIYFAKKNSGFKKSSINLTSKSLLADKQDIISTISAQQINFKYDDNLIAQQAYSMGRSKDVFSNISILLQAYIAGIYLPPAFHYKESELNKLITPLAKSLDSLPVEGLFNFENGRVIAFKLSKNGQKVETESLKEKILTNFKLTTPDKTSQIIEIKIPLKILEPKISTEKINNYGIKELIAEGTSLFQHSIENRIYNINLASQRLNGVLIPPGEIFSFGKAVGDVSSLTGYKQAYVISGGKTILGDGGGVCQVSTTLFRATLNAGLPITERHQHAYRVGYYEQDSPLGIDAAVYVPSVDLKFKNDTTHHILIQTIIDFNEQRLTFQLFGTKDNREVTINKPIILSQSGAPPDEYQDDPTLPKGQIKQIDFSAGGANVYFTRTVKKDGKIITDDKFVSNYRPWKAVFLRGTKE